MLPLMMHMYAGFLGDGARHCVPRIDSEVANQLSYMESALKAATISVAKD